MEIKPKLNVLRQLDDQEAILYDLKAEVERERGNVQRWEDEYNHARQEVRGQPNHV